MHLSIYSRRMSIWTQPWETSQQVRGNHKLLIAVQLCRIPFVTLYKLRVSSLEVVNSHRSQWKLNGSQALHVWRSSRKLECPSKANYSSLEVVKKPVCGQKEECCEEKCRAWQSIKENYLCGIKINHWKNIRKRKACEGWLSLIAWFKPRS